MQGVGYADDCPPSIERRYCTKLAQDKGAASGAESSSA